MTKRDMTILIYVMVALVRLSKGGQAMDAVKKEQPRGQPDNAGQFASAEGAGKSSGASGKSKSFAEYKKAAGGDHYKAAQEFYKKELMGKPAKAKMGKLGEKSVNFTRSEMGKFQQNMKSDPVKAESLQHVRDVIENGKYLGKTDSYKKEDRFTVYHHFQKEIPLKDENGNPRKLIVDVGRRKNGELEYAAHSFIHNKADRYGAKVAHLRGAGINAEDSKKKGGIQSPPLCFLISTDRGKHPVSAKKIPPSFPRVNSSAVRNS